MYFYGSKITLGRPNNFGRLCTNSFWSGPNHIGQGLSIKSSPANLDKPNLCLTKMIWTRTNQFEPNKNNLNGPNHFGPIEGQGINVKNHLNLSGNNFHIKIKV